MLETEFKIDKKCKQTKNIKKKSTQIGEQFPIKSQTQQKSTKNHVNRSSLVHLRSKTIAFKLSVTCHLWLATLRRDCLSAMP